MNENKTPDSSGKIKDILDKQLKHLNVKTNLVHFPDLLFFIDNEGKILDARDISGKDLICHSEKLLGLNIQDCEQNGVGQIFSEAIEAVKLKGGLVNFEYQLNFKDNILNYYDAIIVPSVNKNLIIIVRNITEKKKIFDTITSAAGSTSDIEQVFKSSVDSIHKNLDKADSVVIYMINGNQAVAKAYIGSTEEYINTAGVIDKPNGIVWKTILDDKVFYSPDIEKDEIISEAGRKMGTQSYISFPINYEGSAVGCVIVHSFTKNAFEKVESKIIDIVRKQVEVAYKNKRQTKAIKESHEKYKTLVEQSTDLIIETDMTGTFLYVSPNHEDILGYKPEELIGKNVFENIHPDDRENIIIESKNSLEEKRSGIIIFRYQHKNGEWKYLESKGRQYESADGQLRSVITSTDITEKRKKEEESLRIEKLDSLAVLAGGIAHDFNNLLSTISGNIYLASECKDNETFCNERIEEADKAVTRASDLTQQLLTFAKGGAPIRKMSSLRDVLTDSTDFALRGSNVKSIFSIDDNLFGAEIDVGQISQVINNIVINAKQSMPGGGIVFVSASNKSREELDNPELSANEYIEISISDNGCGIDEDQLTKIFDPYFTTKEKGSGLGLATSHSIIKNHEGIIRVESIKDEGTTFTIYIPAIDKDISETKDSATTEFRGEGKILLMDDDFNVRDMLIHVIEGIGFEVDSASEGEETIELFKQSLNSGNKYKFVLLDLTIPGGMGGKETILRLREIDPNIKAIATSGYSEDSIHTNYSDFGFNGFIGKPFKVKEFKKLIQDVLNQ